MNYQVYDTEKFSLYEINCPIDDTDLNKDYRPCGFNVYFYLKDLTQNKKIRLAWFDTISFLPLSGTCLWDASKGTIDIKTLSFVKTRKNSEDLVLTADFVIENKDKVYNFRLQDIESDSLQLECDKLFSNSAFTIDSWTGQANTFLIATSC